VSARRGSWQAAVDYCRGQRKLWAEDVAKDPDGRDYAHGWHDALLALETILTDAPAAGPQPTPKEE
jgi:hypothetical protein